jgi:Tol biopolymer transport system component
LQTFNRFDRAEAAALSVTKDGARLVYTRGVTYANLWRLTAGVASARQQLTTGTAAKSGVAVSPDGKWIAFVRRGPTGADVYKLPSGGGAPQQLTMTGRAIVGAGGSSSVAWSPDGKQLAFGVFAGGLRVAVISADGGPARIFDRTRLNSGTANLTWAPGSKILYNYQGNRNFHFLDAITGAERPLVSNDSIGWMPIARYSPQGDRVAVWWNRQPEGHSVWVVTLRDSSQVLVSKGWDWPFGWSRDGRSIYTVNALAQEPAVRAVPLSGAQPRTLVALPSVNSACAVERQSQPLSLICMIPEYVADVWMIEHFASDAS